MNLNAQQKRNFVYEIEENDSTVVFIIPSGDYFRNLTGKDMYLISEYALKTFVQRSINYRICDSLLTEVLKEKETYRDKLKKEFSKGLILGSSVSIAVVLLIKILTL